MQINSFLGVTGLKALGVLVTIKLKVILLLLFFAGLAYYGVKVWSGTAFGCPEPIIQEVIQKPIYSDHSLPYSSYSPYPGADSYPGIGYSAASPYASYPSASYPGDYSAGPSNAYLPPSGTGAPTNQYLPPTGSSGGPSNQYLPPSGPTSYNSPPPGASISSRAMDIGGMDVSDLIFRFLGVDTMDCRMRFVCELEYRTRSNPLMGFAFEYIGDTLFKQYRSIPKSSSGPKKFTDCARVYNQCKAPGEQNMAVLKRRRPLPNTTTSEPETTETNQIDFSEERSS